MLTNAQFLLDRSLDFLWLAQHYRMKLEQILSDVSILVFLRCLRDLAYNDHAVSRLLRDSRQFLLAALYHPPDPTLVLYEGICNNIDTEFCHILPQW